MKRQGKLCPLNDIETVYDELLVSQFFDDIELVVLPAKFPAPKYLTYKGTKDHMAHIIHFKMTMLS